MTTIDTLKSRYPGAQTFTIGDNAALSEELLALIRAGRKTATCMPLREVENGPEAMPVVGRCDIALTWDGRPALIVQTLAVTRCRFDEVDEDFALAEGENVDLEGWRRDHRAYFERTGGFAADMTLVCERFRLVEDFG